jgi:hypothetical protein
MDKKQEATAREGRDENKKEREKIRREKGKIRKINYLFLEIVKLK